MADRHLAGARPQMRCYHQAIRPIWAPVRPKVACPGAHGR